MMHTFCAPCLVPCSTGQVLFFCRPDTQGSIDRKAFLLRQSEGLKTSGGTEVSPFPAKVTTQLITLAVKMIPNAMLARFPIMKAHELGPCGRMWSSLPIQTLFTIDRSSNNTDEHVTTSRVFCQAI